MARERVPNFESAALFRLAIAKYCGGKFDLSLDFLMEALRLDRSSRHINAAIKIVIARINSSKDRPKTANVI